MPGGSKSSPPKQKPSEVAADTKRNFLPHIRSQYGSQNSWLVAHPLTQLKLQKLSVLSHPTFFVQSGDPVDQALAWQAQKRSQNPNSQVWVPVICGANDKRPGGDWETGVQGYEERLCRRSSLSVTLATPAPESQGAAHGSNFPVPSTGGIYSPCVVVFRGPQYQNIPAENWDMLPVVSIPPTRWPKLVPDGTKYSFNDEREIVRDKIRGALLFCAYNGHDTVVISGDWGLGNGYRNPPRELAEMWREVLLWDPDLRGRIREVAFIFEDETQCTAQMILAEASKKESKKGGSSKSSLSPESSGSGGSKGKGKGKGAGANGASSASGAVVSDYPSDAQIFSAVFEENEVRRVLEKPDERYGLHNLLT